MKMNEVVKVTVWPVTAGYDKETGKYCRAKSNQWCIGVFDKDGNGVTLADVMDGEARDKKMDVYVKKTLNWNAAVALAAQFAQERGLKASEKVTANAATAKAEYAAEEKAKEKAKAERKEKADKAKADKAFAKMYPELVATREVRAALAKAEEVAKTSDKEYFVAGVKSMTKVATTLEATLAAAIAGADKQSEELEKAYRNAS